LLKSEEYKPIAKSVIENTIQSVADSDVITTFRGETGVAFPLVISSSFVDRGTRQIFWDIVSPALKFENLARR
jgi:hypothetical protein